MKTLRSASHTHKNKSFIGDFVGWPWCSAANEVWEVCHPHGGKTYYDIVERKINQWTMPSSISCKHWNVTLAIAQGAQKQHLVLHSTMHRAVKWYSHEDLCWTSCHMVQNSGIVKFVIDCTKSSNWVDLWTHDQKIGPRLLLLLESKEFDPFTDG